MYGGVQGATHNHLHFYHGPGALNDFFPNKMIGAQSQRFRQDWQLTMEYLSWDVVQRDGNPRMKEIKQLVQDTIADGTVKQSIRDFLKDQELVYSPPYLLIYPKPDSEAHAAKLKELQEKPEGLDAYMT